MKKLCANCELTSASIGELCKDCWLEIEGNENDNRQKDSGDSE